MREETLEHEQKFKHKQKRHEKHRNPMVRRVRPGFAPGSPQVPPRFARGSPVFAGGGRRQGRRASITFGYYRRPPARARARGRRPDLKADACSRAPADARGRGKILGRCGANVAQIRPRLAYVGYVGPSWGYVGSSYGYVGPSWALG